MPPPRFVPMTSELRGHRYLCYLIPNIKVILLLDMFCSIPTLKGKSSYVVIEVYNLYEAKD